ncbi:MAG: hypothetical protein ACYDDF_14870 [Thermoplasmatota archaeon]
MRKAFLAGAEAKAVAGVANDVVLAKGGHVKEHTRTHVRFQALRGHGGRADFRRHGALHIIQHAGEDDIELRLRIRATVPARFFWWSTTIDLLLALLLIVGSGAIGATEGFIFAAGLAFWVVFAAAGLFYIGTVPASRALEQDVMSAILEASRPFVKGVQTEEDAVRARAREEAAAAALANRLTKRRREEDRDAPQNGENPGAP